MVSTSPRTTSSELLRLPISWEPSGFLHSESSFRAYSSSIEARPGIVQLESRHKSKFAGRGTGPSHRCKMISAHRKSAWRRAFCLEVEQRQRRPCPKNYWRLHMVSDLGRCYVETGLHTGQSDGWYLCHCGGHLVLGGSRGLKKSREFGGRDGQFA
jgi:hypothetical protein